MVFHVHELAAVEHARVSSVVELYIVTVSLLSSSLIAGEGLGELVLVLIECDCDKVRLCSVVAVVICGEGGSGAAVGVGVADGVVAMGVS